MADQPSSLTLPEVQKLILQEIENLTIPEAHKQILREVASMTMKELIQIARDGFSTKFSFQLSTPKDEEAKQEQEEEKIHQRLAKMSDQAEEKYNQRLANVSEQVEVKYNQRLAKMSAQAKKECNQRLEEQRRQMMAQHAQELRYARLNSGLMVAGVGVGLAAVGLRLLVSGPRRLPISVLRRRFH